MQLEHVPYNANPFQYNCGDCVVRAIAKCEKITWEKALKNICKVAIKIKHTPTETRTIRTYLGDRYKTIWYNCRFDKFVPPNNNCLLLLHNKSNNWHMIYVENGRYFDTSKLDKTYTVSECYVPIIPDNGKVQSNT